MMLTCGVAVIGPPTLELMKPYLLPMPGRADVARTEDRHADAPKAEMTATMPKSRLSNAFLWAFVVSIAVTALVGATAIAMPMEQHWIDLRIILTTATIAGASVCGLACGGCLGRGHRVLPTAGLVLAVVSGVLLLIGIWAEV